MSGSGGVRSPQKGQRVFIRYPPFVRSGLPYCALCFLRFFLGEPRAGGSLTYSAPCSNRSMACARSELTRRVMGISKRLAHWYRGGIRSSRIFGEYTMPLYSLWVV